LALKPVFLIPQISYHIALCSANLRFCGKREPKQNCPYPAGCLICDESAFGALELDAYNVIQTG
jgi:hypothetical protein